MATALVSRVSVASKARKAERSIGLPVATRSGPTGTGTAATPACGGAAGAAGAAADTPSQWSKSSVPGIRRLAVMLGRSPKVASIWPDIGVPTAVRLPSKVTRFSSPLKAPAAEMAPMPLCARPVATDRSRLAS